ncbi:hypothetical protein E4U24_000216 [Claviceps purpurea]|nr:hypothetical protein E4U28_001021 [Claviceps purpurea]KAG6150883.1 hypothetical protein E4U37_005571 [Claviceps purpurea]KAG6169163.1 hypothetical protein E4U11_004646 [Claviceps purpurea]KAG6206520.1 hypothetical protein E4U50_004190 [Claviceps purpurea]KAG6252763.1 hypothetical protein E4U24_000216 [Claviceps purpurea]
MSRSGTDKNDLNWERRREGNTPVDIVFRFRLLELPQIKALIKWPFNTMSSCRNLPMSKFFSRTSLSKGTVRSNCLLELQGEFNLPHRSSDKSCNDGVEIGQIDSPDYVPDAEGAA